MPLQQPPLAALAPPIPQTQPRAAVAAVPAAAVAAVVAAAASFAPAPPPPAAAAMSSAPVQVGASVCVCKWVCVHVRSHVLIVSEPCMQVCVRVLCTYACT